MSSRFCSMSSNQRRRICARSFGSAFAQGPKARAAASIERTASAWPKRGTLAMSAPVAGLRTASTPSPTHLPSTRHLSLRRVLSARFIERPPKGEALIAGAALIMAFGQRFFSEPSYNNRPRPRRLVRKKRPRGRASELRTIGPRSDGAKAILVRRGGIGSASGASLEALCLRQRAPQDEGGRRGAGRKGRRCVAISRGLWHWRRPGRRRPDKGGAAQAGLPWNRRRHNGPVLDSRDGEASPDL